MTKEKGKNVWLIMLILACIFLSWTIFTISNGDTILENGIKIFYHTSYSKSNSDK